MLAAGLLKRLARWPSDWQLIARTLAEVQYKVGSKSVAKQCSAGSRVVKKGCWVGKLLLSDWKKNYARLFIKRLVV